MVIQPDLPKFLLYADVGRDFDEYCSQAVRVFIGREHDAVSGR